MKGLGIGVVGLGMGRNVLYTSAMDEFVSEVRGICDSDEQKLESNKNEFNVPFATTEYRELLERDDIDIMAIFSPDHLHFQMIKDSLEAGKHLIVTKPMVISLEEAQETVRLVNKYDRKLLVGQTRRYAKRFIMAKQLFDSGKIGNPLFAEAHYMHDMRSVFTRSTWRYEVPKDFLYGGACHPIDHLRWFFGDVDEVFCYGNPSTYDLRYPQDKALNFLINMKFKNGLIGRALNAQGICHPPKGTRLMDEFSVYGDRGTIINSRARWEDEDGTEHDVELTEEKAEIDFDGKEYKGHRYEVFRYVREIEQAILNNTKPSVNEIDGAKTTAISAAAWESIHTGLPVKVFNEF